MDKNATPSLSHQEGYKHVYSAEGLQDVECWDCLEPLDVEEMLDATHEPYNGICITCKCGREYTVVVGFRISPID
jgi:hypothetical protein